MKSLKGIEIVKAAARLHSLNRKMKVLETEANELKASLRESLPAEGVVFEDTDEHYEVVCRKVTQVKPVLNEELLIKGMSKNMPYKKFFECIKPRLGELKKFYLAEYSEDDYQDLMDRHTVTIETIDCIKFSEVK